VQTTIKDDWACKEEIMERRQDSIVSAFLIRKGTAISKAKWESTRKFLVPLKQQI
jgi:hypothetical protein